MQTQEKRKTTPFGVNMKRSQVLYRAAQHADTTSFAAIAMRTEHLPAARLP